MNPAAITVIGAGTMGANIALNFAANGYSVRLQDIDARQLERAMETVRSNAAMLRSHGLLAVSVDDVAGRIATGERMEKAVAGSELVIEAVPERLELKHELFKQLDQLCGDATILASNTSTFVPSSLADGILGGKRKERFLVMHYWNPAHLVPLVELVPHPLTRPAVVGEIKGLLERCGKTPVLVRREIAGFIGNRLAFALQREAMDLVARGIASPEDVDTVARAGFGRRIPISGVFGTADLGGLDVYLEVCRSIFAELCADKEPPNGLKQLVEQGKLGVKSGAGWKRYSEEKIARLKQDLTAELIRHLRRDHELAARSK